MADIQYKKGELLVDETISSIDFESNMGSGEFQTQLLLAEDILIVDFNETTYVCEANYITTGNVVTSAYGGFDGIAPDFTEYPFIIANGGTQGPNGELVISEKIYLTTETPGTYSVKIYTAIEDSDSTESNPVITYLMSSPSNTNWNVLSSLLGDGDWSKLKAYVETTPKNMNRQVLKALLGSGSSGSSAVVGTAVVGRDTVG